MEEFDRNKLSAREDEILAFAIEGATDHQIAQSLDISVSTVNSYWVRIRGKLGQLSRTELVSLALRQEAKRELDQVRRESREFELRAARRDQEDADLKGAERHRAILHAMPEPVLATDERGTIVFANRRLEALFGYEEGDLCGQHIDVLVPRRNQEKHRQQVAEYNDNPYSLRLGVAEVIYGQRKDGSLVRVLLNMDAQHTAEGLIVTCIVRSFLDEVDLARRRAASVVSS